jgi:hypothetical protein
MTTLSTPYAQEKRATYTDKILALVGTVKKYRTEINTILIDNKNVQKEINILIDTLGRTFTDVEDLIYKVRVLLNTLSLI